MGQVPAKSFLPAAPFGSSQAANVINQVQPPAQTPQFGQSAASATASPLGMLSQSAPQSPFSTTYKKFQGDPF